MGRFYISGLMMIIVFGMAGVFLLGRAMSWELFPLLLGAALGLTIPAFFFAARLVKLNDALHTKTPAEQKKGDEDDGGAL